MAMKIIPQTSERHYLTGMTALNIPMEDGHIADWHFTGAFLHPSSRFHIAGENRLDTHDHLGDYGIRECSDVLRRFGAQVAPGQKVYAATYVRAILDLVLSSILNGHFPAHVEVHDLLYNEKDLSELAMQVTQLQQRIKDPKTLDLLERWRKFALGST